jgi:hypothetical protein
MPKKWHTNSGSSPEQTMERIVERAIQEGKLFELLFTENGRRLWQAWGEERIRDLIFQKLNIKRR